MSHPHPKLRVLLDGRPLQGPTGERGVGRYVRELSRGLAGGGADLEPGLLVDPRLPPPLDPPAGIGLVDLERPPGPAFLWGRLLGPRWLRRGGAQLWHATFLAPPRVPDGLPWVATIHDLIPLRHPAPYGRRQRLVFRRSLGWAAEAHRVVAVSRFTADLVQDELDVPAERIEVIPSPVDVARFAAAEPRALAGADRPHVLHAGGFDALKGVHDLLLPAFVQVSRERPELVLALTGAPGPGRARAERLAGELGLGERVKFVGLLDEAAHASAVRGAALVVAASREEGFGYPVAEALAAGVPVAVGPAAACREAAGDQASLAADASPGALARAMLEALAAGGPESGAGEARRARAARFGTERVAALMGELYRSLGGAA